MLAKLFDWWANYALKVGAKAAETDRIFISGEYRSMTTTGTFVKKSRILISTFRVAISPKTKLNKWRVTQNIIQKITKCFIEWFLRFQVSQDASSGWSSRSASSNARFSHQHQLEFVATSSERVCSTLFTHAVLCRHLGKTGQHANEMIINLSTLRATRNPARDLYCIKWGFDVSWSHWTARLRAAQI